MTTPDPDRSTGLYSKYRVEDLNGKPIGPVFVLAYETDPHAQVAKRAYEYSSDAPLPDQWYLVEKMNGKPTGAVFVLDYANDPHAQVALAAYAESCDEEFPALADDLRYELRRFGVNA